MKEKSIKGYCKVCGYAIFDDDKYKIKDKEIYHNECLNERLSLMGKIFMNYIITHRNNLALKYIKLYDKNLLDIAGGNGYLARKCICKEATSIDERGNLFISKNKKRILNQKNYRGSKITDILPFKDKSFHYITMIAFIEHLEEPEKIINEIYRIIKDDGLLIITTPFKIVEKIIPLLGKNLNQLNSKEVKEEHKYYFNLKLMNRLTKGMFKIILYKKFELGLNQLFIYRKKHKE